MADIIITGASRGIGRALALELAAQKSGRLIVTARDQAALEGLVGELKGRGGDAIARAGDLGALRGARQLGLSLADMVQAGATLVHNAGIWPAERVINEDGVEMAFAVNHLSPLEVQRPLLAAGLIRRVMVVSAGLIGFGKFDAALTPTGRDFSRFRTYCTTKLCFAVATRDVAAEYKDVDFVVLHPGVVKTGLGARPGVVGSLLSLAKQVWEPPEGCARRLGRILGKERWSSPGDAAWMMQETVKPWPAPAQNAAMRRAIRETTAAFALPPDSAALA